MKTRKPFDPKVFRRIPSSYLLFGILPLSACGGGGGAPGDNSGSPSETVTLSGEVVKGPVANVIVFIDYNGDGQLSAGEPSQRTDSNGGFSFVDVDGEGPIIALTDGTSVDTSSGLVIDGMRLTAPEGSSVISPLTTIMQEGGLTNAQVVAALGLPDVDLTSFNPFTADTAAETALAVEIAAQQISVIVRSLSAAMQEAGVSEADAANIAAAAIADAVAGAGTVDLTSSNIVTSAIQNAVAELPSSQASAVSAIASEIATAAANVNSAIGSATDLTSSETVDAFRLIADLTTQIGNAVANGGDASQITFTDPGAIDDTLAEEHVNSEPTGEVTITGTARQGETLTANTDALDDADGLGAFSYQWKAGGVAITGATSSTLTLTQDQVGKAITVDVRYTDGGSTFETVSSSGTSAVENVNDAPTGEVTITGTARQGETLTANTDALDDPDGLGNLSYQWLRDGSAVSGATSSSYMLVEVDIGAQISVMVSYTDDGGTNESVTSVETSLVVSGHELFSIQFDYRFDDIGFFSDPSRRDVLDEAARIWGEIIHDDFADIPAGVSFDIVDPSDGITTQSVTLTQPIDDVMIFVGAQPTSSFLGKAGPDGLSAEGDIFRSRISDDFRGAGPVTDFEPWVGSMTFSSTADWNFDINQTPSGKYDFLSAALHEIAHVLGYGTSAAFDEFVSAGRFWGPNAVDENGGAPVLLVSLSDTHVVEDYRDDSVLMDPTLTDGIRILPTDLDKAILADIGYSIIGFNQQGSQPPIVTEAGEVIVGTIVNDVLNGSGGNDEILGNKGDDWINGGEGDDVIRGDGDDDTLLGGSGADQLIGGSGSDILVGGGGDDNLWGDGDDDTLLGGSGADQLIGGSGSDILVGGGGDDNLWGDGGSDFFIFGSGSGYDKIIDFDFDNDLIVFAESLFASAQLALSNVTSPYTNVFRIDLSGGNHVDVFHEPENGDFLTASNFQIIEDGDILTASLLVA